jgi:hypothetical protein
MPALRKPLVDVVLFKPETTGNAHYRLAATDFISVVAGGACYLSSAYL